MSHQIHITRAARWHDSAEKPILIEEWRDCIASNPHLEARLEILVVNPKTGEKIGIPLNEGAALDVDQCTAFFHYNEGRISVSNVPEALPLIREIANSLNASIQEEEAY